MIHKPNSLLVTFDENGCFTLTEEIAAVVGAGSVQIKAVTVNALPDNFYNVGCATGSNGTNPACFNSVDGVVTTTSVEGTDRPNHADYACFGNIGCM